MLSPRISPADTSSAAACCVYHRGEKVVDLWGGVRNKSSGEPWEEDTMVVVYSATVWPFGSEWSFGSPGSGGSLGFADPKARIGYGYVTSQMGTTLTGDPRDFALRNALYSIISH